MICEQRENSEPWFFVSLEFTPSGIEISKEKESRKIEEDFLSCVYLNIFNNLFKTLIYQFSIVSEKILLISLNKKAHY